MKKPNTNFTVSEQKSSSDTTFSFNKEELLKVRILGTSGLVIGNSLLAFEDANSVREFLSCLASELLPADDDEYEYACEVFVSSCPATVRNATVEEIACSKSVKEVFDSSCQDAIRRLNGTPAAENAPLFATEFLSFEDALLYAFQNAGKDADDGELFQHMMAQGSGQYLAEFCGLDEYVKTARKYFDGALPKMKENLNN